MIDSTKSSPQKSEVGTFEHLKNLKESSANQQDSFLDQSTISPIKKFAMPDDEILMDQEDLTMSLSIFDKA